MGMDWRPIEQIPQELLDGREVAVKRVFEGRVVKEGLAVFDFLHEKAPARQPLGPDPLGRLSAEDYARETNDTREYVGKKRWLNPGRMYAFPAPTHFACPTTSAA